MVAYSFQPQFIMPIETRRKHQTLRDVGKRRHAERGDVLQLYTGMRTRACRLIGTATCTGLSEVEISFASHQIGMGERLVTAPESLDAFAQLDGFADFAEMKTFWAKHHPGISEWSGLMIQWGDTFVSAA